MTEIQTLIKWAGGKKQLLKQFKIFFPKNINRYFEPFVGGGAVAFHIIQNKKPKYIYLSNINGSGENLVRILSPSRHVSG